MFPDFNFLFQIYTSICVLKEGCIHTLLRAQINSLIRIFIQHSKHAADGGMTGSVYENTPASVINNLPLFLKK
jgi:hypothetical protein